MKKTSTLLVVFALPTLLFAQQYCLPNPDHNSGNMQISNVEFNTISRSSSTWESYVHTGMKSEVVQGTDYSMKITADEGAFCPQFDLRVYIDWNGDKDFEDVGESVGSWDNQTKKIFDLSVIIPSDAKLGTTRMRVMHKMIESCGHTKIEPCGSDSFMYHGEVEDYELEIKQNTLSVNSIGDKIESVNIWFDYKNGEIKMDELNSNPIKIRVLDITGKMIYQRIGLLEQQQSIKLNSDKGIVFVLIDLENGERINRKLVVQ